MQCPSCGSEIRESAQFCEVCGARAPEEDSPLAHLANEIRARQAGLEGERKQVTILFADLVDSMELAQQIDPEDWRTIMDRFFQVLADGVHELEGTVNSFTGDGIMAIFGAPVAHEDHARRACLAALKLRQDVAVFGEEFRRSHGRDLAIRIGLNSGEVIAGTIGDRGDMTYTAIGHTAGLAQRMEQEARPGGICLSSNTAALVEGYVRLREPAVHEIKGAGRMEAFELEGVAAPQDPIDVARSRGLTPLIGRDEELRTLESAFEASLGGPGELVGIVGEPGVGKSRLCFEIAERCRARGIPVFQVAAQAHERGVPLLPVLRLLRSYFEIDGVASDLEARNRVESRLDWLGDRLADEALLLFDFLGIADPERPLERMDVEARHRRLLELVRRLIYAQSVREPALTIFDDLHWIDPASEAFLQAYAEAAQGTRGLTLLSFRPDYSAPWMSRSYYRQIPLAALHGEKERELIDELLGGDPSLADVRDLISRRSEGNPFFAEELIRSLAGSGHLTGGPGTYRLAKPISEAEMPATVQAVLAARIDRLPADRKAVLEAAAVLGKEFSVPLLDRVTDFDEPSLNDSLRALVAGEFLFERAPGREATYAFRHPLTQEVAYRSQLRERRRPLHAAAAAAIIDHHADQLDETSALIAHHWESAGEELEAARWYARTAAWSGNRDPAESVRRWTGWSSSGRLPGSEEAERLGLAARVAIVHLGWRLGLSDDEAARTLQGGGADGEQGRRSAPADPSPRWVRRGAGLGQGKIDEYAQLARAALALAEEADDPSLCMPPNAWAFFLTGDFHEGLAALDRALEAAGGDPTFGAGMIFACPLALCLAQKAAFLTMLGEFDAAGEALEEGRAMARDYGDPEALAYNRPYGSFLGHLRRKRRCGVGTRPAERVDLAERIGDSLSRVWAWTHLGVAELMQRAPRDQATEALQRAKRSPSRVAQGSDEGRSPRMAYLAEARLGAGDPERPPSTRSGRFASRGDQGGPVAVDSGGPGDGAGPAASVPGPLRAERIDAELGIVLEMCSRDRGARLRALRSGSSSPELADDSAMRVPRARS